MTKRSRKKICIVATSLGGGGAERSSALLSEILYGLGYDIHIVTVLDDVSYPYKGDLLNLGELKRKDDSVYGRLKRLRILKNYIRLHEFDFIIDNRTRAGSLKEFVIARWLYASSKAIFCVRSYSTSAYIHPNTLIAKLIYKNAFKWVTVSHAIEDKIVDKYNLKNVITIHNPVEHKIDVYEQEDVIKDTFIIFYGRFNDAVKNISLLLEAYSKSKLPAANVHLKLLGNGKDKTMLVKKSERLQIKDKVQFLEFSPDPFSLVKMAHFTVLTSHYEGFPRVLVESLSLGTPVVSVDCKSGPNEIVVHKHNGLLIENHNTEVLAAAMNTMLEDKELYLHCKSNAKASVMQFSKNAIGQKWQQILE